MMKLCGSCQGLGCEACDYEGVEQESVQTSRKIVRNHKMKYNDYLDKKEREMNKIDKKNSREG